LGFSLDVPVFGRGSRERGKSPAGNEKRKSRRGGVRVVAHQGEGDRGGEGGRKLEKEGGGNYRTEKKAGLLAE